MITYELAKKLKDAGFPQNARMGAFISDPEGYNGDCYAPTLEELIEACGNITFRLYRDQSEISEKIFYICTENCGNRFGSTPGEAVASLWLELHKIPVNPTETRINYGIIKDKNVDNMGINSG